MKVIPPSILTFDPQELEWLIAGQPQIDIADWKENTVYWGEYHTFLWGDQLVSL